MIKQRYNVLYKLITILTFSCHHLYYYIMSLVQASVSASAFFLACLERVVNFLLMKVLFRQLLSDVRKMIWTIHRWYLFKLLPVESPEDSQFIGNVILWYDVADELQQLEYDHKWASVHDECLMQLCWYLPTADLETDSARSVPHLWLSLRDLFLSIYTFLCKLHRFYLKPFIHISEHPHQLNFL